MKKTCKIAVFFLTVILLFSACSVQEPVETKTDAQILAERRDLVESKMRWAMTVLWRLDEDLVYSKISPSAGVDLDSEADLMRLKAGRIYQGLPYTHGSGSVYSFLSFAREQNSNGVYELSGMHTALLNGGNGVIVKNVSRLASDCADSVSWAWNHVSSSVYFTLTRNMTDLTGCIKVGDYEFSETAYARTKDDCKRNGEAVMFASYAQLQKADAVVKYNNAGHAMMVVQVHVVKDGEQIDAEQSYVTVLEQISSNMSKEVCYFDETLQENVYVGGGVDIKYTFRQLFDQGYLPITCKELIDPSPLAEEKVTDSEENHTKDNIFKGTFLSPYRISSVTITITDASGKTVQQLTGFGIESEMMRFRLSRLTTSEEAEVVVGSIDLDALPAGTYRCTHTCQIATGKILTVRDFEFTV